MTLKFSTDAVYKKWFYSIDIIVVVRTTSTLLGELAKRVWSYSPLTAEVRIILETF